MVGFNVPAEEGFTEAEGGVNHCFCAPAAERVCCKEYTRSIALDHLLHDYRKSNVGLVDAVTGPVGNGARGPQAAPAVDDGAKQGFVPDNVEERVLLAGEGHAWKVFCRS